MTPLRAGHGDNCAWCQGEANQARTGRMRAAAAVIRYLGEVAVDIGSVIWDGYRPRHDRKTT